MSDYIKRADAMEAVCEECSERWKHYKECDLYKDGQCFEITALMALPSVDAEQVTSKLKNPCDSLLTEDSEDSKEQKSKLDHDREWIIGCIKHDGFIKTDRFDKANQIILDALQFTEHFDLLKEHESLQEVVRCKDCRWWQYNNDGYTHANCHWCETETPDADDFCLLGERIEP